MTNMLTYCNIFKGDLVKNFIFLNQLFCCQEKISNKFWGHSWAFFCLHMFSVTSECFYSWSLCLLFHFTVLHESVEDTAAVQTWLCCRRSQYLTRQKSINIWLFILESNELLTGCNLLPFITLWALKPLILSCTSKREQRIWKAVTHVQALIQMAFIKDRLTLRP